MLMPFNFRPVYSLVILSLFASLAAPQAMAATWEWTTPTPGATNIGATVAPATQDTVNDSVTIASVTLVVSEVFAKGSNTQAEFVELYNYGTAPVDASGLALVNKAGKTYAIPAGTVIDAGAYYVSYGALPITDSGDEIALQRGSEIIDSLAFDAAMMKDSSSAARYCDVYELRFCENKRSVPTPGAANALEPLKVSVTPADGVLRPGQKAVFTANMPGARIVLSPLDAQTPDDSFVYETPLTIQQPVTYWYYAQLEGQATVAQKISFRVDVTAPSQEQFLQAADLSLSEVMVDKDAKTGWVEIHNKGKKEMSLQDIRIDTRARATDDCSSCLAFAGSANVAAGGYVAMNLPKTTVASLLSRQTPVDVRLVMGKDLLDTLTVALGQQPHALMSWGRLEGAFPVTPMNDEAAWSDIPTPAARNVGLLLEDLTSQILTPEVLANAVYTQAAYKDAVLVLRGKAIPSATLAVLNGNTTLRQAHVAADGTWSLEMPHDLVKNIGQVQFRQQVGAVTGMVSAPFALPGFDEQAVSQTTTKKILSAVKQTVQKTNQPVLASKPGVTTASVQLLPSLESMTGVTLTSVASGYNTHGTTLAVIPEPASQQDPVASMLAQAANMFAVIFLGFSR